MAAYFFFFLIIWIDLSNSETFIFGTVRLFSCAFSSLCCWNMTRPLPKEGIHYILNAEKRYSPIEENSIFFLCWFSFWLSWKLVGIDQYCQLGGKKRERDRSSSNSSSSKVANIFALIGYEETFFFFVLKRTPSPKWEWMSPLSQQLMRHLLLLLSGLLFLSLFISPYLFTCGMATLHWANAMNPMQEITVKPLPFQHKWMRPLVHLSR